MVVFVILHYNDLDITIQCINHLLNLDSVERSHIIVVDNGSPNRSGDILKSKFRKNDFVDVLISKKNLGFAKGNNLGYKYARDKYDPDYIVVMNNDVIIKQDNFINELENIKVCFESEVIMPDIINKIGVHQNPFRESPLTNCEMKRNYLMIGMFNILYHFPIINILWNSRKKKPKKNGEKPKNKVENNSMLVPHGACVIFSRKWISNEKIAFVPETFLYGEEDILYEYILNKGYKTYFTNKLVVSHLEDVSTSSVITSDLKRAKFLFSNSFKSQKILLKLRKYNNEKKKYIIQE